MIYPKTRTLTTKILYAKEDINQRKMKTSAQNWRKRFTEAHKGTQQKRNLKANDFIPECYNYAWGYF